MGFVDAGNTVRNRVETVGERGGMEGGKVRERETGLIVGDYTSL